MTRLPDYRTVAPAAPPAYSQTERFCVNLPGPLSTVPAGKLKVIDPLKVNANSCALGVENWLSLDQSWSTSLFFFFVLFFLSSVRFELGPLHLPDVVPNQKTLPVSHRDRHH